MQVLGKQLKDIQVLSVIIFQQYYCQGPNRKYHTWGIKKLSRFLLVSWLF